MARNNSSDRSQSSHSGTTIITHGTKLKGNILLAGNFHLDGHLEGNLSSTNAIIIGKAGYVRGNIKAQDVYVSGRVEGNVYADKLEIFAGGSVAGEVQGKKMRMENTARLNGRVVI